VAFAVANAAGITVAIARPMAKCFRDMAVSPLFARFFLSQRMKGSVTGAPSYFGAPEEALV
jgi:hypothetical protein